MCLFTLFLLIVFLTRLSLQKSDWHFYIVHFLQCGQLFLFRTTQMSISMMPCDVTVNDLITITDWSNWFINFQTKIVFVRVIVCDRSMKLRLRRLLTVCRDICSINCKMISLKSLSHFASLIGALYSHESICCKAKLHFTHILEGENFSSV